MDWLPAPTTTRSFRADKIGPLPARAIRILCALLALGSLHPLISSGFLWGHDTGAHLFRLAELARALGDGVLYPRFLPDAYGGLGGPILNFNPVLPYYLPALLVLAGVGPIAALKIASALLVIASGFAMAILARPHAGRAGAAIAGLAYVYLPYHIANLYVRMAFSELAAMVILPLAMAAARRAALHPSGRRLALAGLLTALLPASHFTSTVFGLPFILFYALAFARKGTHLRTAALFAAILAAALLVSAFSWLPALVEVEGTHYRDATQGYDNYANHFVSIGQILSPRWGFGSSKLGGEDQMSFQAGWVHLLALAILLGAALRLPGVRPLAFFCVVSAAGSAFLMLPVSAWLWRILPILQNLQFPWRLLFLSGIATSLAAGAAVVLPRRLEASPRGKGAARRKGKPGPGIGLLDRRPLLVPALAGALLVAACIPYLQARHGEGSDADFRPESMRRRYFGELKWQPAEVKTLRYRPDGRRAQLSTGGSARIVEDRTHRLAVEIDSAAPATLRLHLFNSPGWTARIGDGDLPLRSEPGTAMMLVEVPAGRHRVELRYVNTPLRTVSWILSGAGALLIGAGLLAPARPAGAMPPGKARSG